MQDTLQLTGIQTDLVWESPAANRRAFGDIMDSLHTPGDIILLPEMFATGFSMKPQGIADTGESLEWMKAQAATLKTAIAGSLMVNDKGNYYNRFYFVTPDGSVSHYDKRHRFTLAGEHKVYEAGSSFTIVEHKGWKIALQVCYDLRFPVFSRNTQGYDLLLYVANWPEKRVFAWDTLLRARAIENMAYCAGINRIGKDGNGYAHNGHSAIYDMLGATMAAAEDKDTVITASLSAERLRQTRQQLNFLSDRDRFQLEAGSSPLH